MRESPQDVETLTPLQISKRKEYQKHKERYRARNKEYAHTHLEQKRVCSKNDYKKHRVARMAKKKEYNLKNAERIKQYNKIWWIKNQKRWSKIKREENIKCKNLVFSHYGPECVCCGEKNIGFLTIDHINGGGSRHRRQIGNTYVWLIKNNFPEGFQVLCMNCNWGKKATGICPHNI